MLRVAATYAKASTATNKNKLSDPYVKAIRWASDRIGEEGVVAFVTNNGFLDGVAFDGMRKHLADDFDVIYILDLGWERPQEPKTLGQNTQRFWDSGGCEHQFISSRRTGGDNANSHAEIFYARVDEFWRQGG